MKVTSERLEGSRVGFDMEFEPDELNKAMDKVYRKLVNKVNIPGFRPGKAPRYMVERVIGREAMMEDAINEVLPDALKKAMADNPDLEFVGEPESDIKNQEPLTVRVIMQVMPSVELPADYREIRVHAVPVDVSDEEVTRSLASLQAERTKWRFPEHERPAKLGDRAHVDIQGFTADGPLTSKVQKDVLDLTPVEEGGNLLPDLLNGLVGMNVGEEKDIATTFPEDYGREDVRGQDVTFNVKLVEIQEPEERPSLEELAKEQNLADADALREQVRQQLTEQREKAAREHQLNDMLVELNNRVDVALPDALVQEGVERRVSEMEENLSRQKLKLNQYLGYLGKSRAEFEQELRPEVERDTKTSLLVEQFARREGITVSDEEVQQEAQRSLDAAIRASMKQQDLESVSDTAEVDTDAMAAAASAELEQNEGEATASSDSEDDTFQQRYDAALQSLAPLLKDESYLDTFRSHLLNRKIEDRLLAIANGEELPPLSASDAESEASAASSEDGETVSDSDSESSATTQETALTPDELAEQEQTAGAGEFAGAKEAPAESDAPPPPPIDAPTSGQTDRAKEENPL